MASDTTIHVFERAGLGRAPYRYTGMSESVYQARPGAPVQPGTCCDYCSAGIRYVFGLLSADGRIFKVGCDCIHKAGDAGLRRAISADVRELERQKRAARAAADVEYLRATLEREDVRALLDTMPHPYTRMADKGHTRLSWAEFNLAHAGAKGRGETARWLRKQFPRQAKSEMQHGGIR